jgi:hypothetical protein
MPEPSEPTGPSDLNIKAQILAEVIADLPDGIRTFLDVELPEPPAATMPQDVDSAILVQGLLAYHLLEVFRPLAGLTLAQLPLWIGQFNTVNVGMLLASLAYRQETQAEQSFRIIEPRAETTYYPGEMRISAEASSGTTISSMSADLAGETFDLVSASGGGWRQYVNVMDNGDYVLTITAHFPTGDPQTQSVAFVIGDEETVEEPDEIEPGAGADADALIKFEGDVARAMRALMDQPINSVEDIVGYAGQWLNMLKTTYGKGWNIAKELAVGSRRDALEQMFTETSGILLNAIDALSTVDEGTLDGKLTAFELLVSLSPGMTQVGQTATRVRRLLEEFLGRPIIE